MSELRKAERFQCLPLLQQSIGVCQSTLKPGRLVQIVFGPTNDEAYWERVLRDQHVWTARCTPYYHSDDTAHRQHHPFSQREVSHSVIAQV